MNAYLIVGALLLFAGAVAFAFRTGKAQGSAEGDKKLDEARKAGLREYRKKAEDGQAIQEKTFNEPIDAVREELKRRAGK